jgi:hypothetical protein
MVSLNIELRNQLEYIIGEARKTAEEAARKVIDEMAVPQPVFLSHLNEKERELRRNLRAHGRQLGDMRKQDGTQTTDFLVEKVAYEHWHRMLFSRFLAENQLLMHPELSIHVTLEECEDLAVSKGLNNGWELAAQYASRMLPQIFRVDSPVFQLKFSPENQRQLERILFELPEEIFTASDSLGWVYQFWQSKRKDKVNASGVKIGVKELPAVTQLFTEPYMVHFLLDNSIGAWWANKRLVKKDLDESKSEQELREKASIQGVPLTYLRFQRSNENVWAPVNGKFEEWPENLSDIKLLDPCCGSGHFLVAAFEMLVPIRMKMGNMAAREAINNVLKENIHGLEIDQRCVEIAVFALALSAWKYPNAGGYRVLPELNIACTGLSININKGKWMELAGTNTHLRYFMNKLYGQFHDSPLLGSLIDPSYDPGRGALSGLTWEEVKPLLDSALSSEESEDYKEVAVVTQGIIQAAQMLTSKYHLVITNVPYLVRGKQSDALREFCDKFYPEGKNDLATVFIERSLKFINNVGSVSLVLPQNWLFLVSYKRLRQKLLKKFKWNYLVKLGSGAFGTITGEVVKSILFSINKGEKSKDHDIKALDVSENNNINEKRDNVIDRDFSFINQEAQLENPDARVIFEKEGYGKLLETYSYSHHGLTSGDMQRMRLNFWEINDPKEKWILYQSTVKSSRLFGGTSSILRWEKGEGVINELRGARKDGLAAWGKKGVLVSQMGELPTTLYCKTSFDNNTAVLIPFDNIHLIAIWCFCSSSKYNEAVRRIDQKMNVTSATLGKIPFDLDHWTKVAEREYPQGLPEPYSNDPTQWIFHGHPCRSIILDEQNKETKHGQKRIDKSVLQVAVARLVGYQWPVEFNDSIELCEESKEIIGETKMLNRFADIDGIVIIPPVRGEIGAEERLETLLAVAYGDQWTANTLDELLTRSNHEGRSLESWLRDKFFLQHCKLFNNRPFIWHIWDGLRDGFSALINYHKLDKKLLETLIYTYLGDWIRQQQQEIASGVDGAEERLIAAVSLKERLELILEGEAPYDIFARWKRLEEQPIGWVPDLNDGVRLNIRPFMMVPDVKRKGAGVLRDKPNVHWKKDRGRDVKTAPWYNLGLEYGGKEGDRINDHHLKLAQKQI